MKLPRDMDAAELINALARLGYRPVRQTGSHNTASVRRSGACHHHSQSLPVARGYTGRDHRGRGRKALDGTRCAGEASVVVKTMHDTHPGEINQPLPSDKVVSVVQPGRADLSDWVELMEAVEALCPVWPMEQQRGEGRYRL